MKKELVMPTFLFIISYLAANIIIFTMNVPLIIKIGFLLFMSLWLIITLQLLNHIHSSNFLVEEMSK